MNVFEKEPINEKNELSEEEKAVVIQELDDIEEILKAIEDGDENYAYADTGDLMESIDSMLKDKASYQETLSARREASGKIMQGDEGAKKEGLKQITEWIEKVRGIV